MLMLFRCSKVKYPLDALPSGYIVSATVYRVFVF